MEASDFESILAVLGICFFERQGRERFLLRGEPKPWLEHVAHSLPDGTWSFAREDGLSFLENFLQDAEGHWERCSRGALHSGLWTEVASGGGELPLEATAVSVPPDRKYLTLELQGEVYESRRVLLQRARETRSRFDLLQREIQKKEILLDYIVHDLRQPLSGIVGALSLLGARPLDEEKRGQLIAMGLRLARRQQELMRQVQDVFATELAVLRGADMDPRLAPDLLALTAESCAAFRPAFDVRGIQLTVRDLVRGPRPLRVMAKGERLERVLANFLENALRHAPAPSTVEVVVSEEGGRARVDFHDRGPGVEPGRVPELFTRFGKSDASPGSGLGLHFCRITCELWGGRVGYQPRPGGGATFWCELQRLPAAQEGGSPPETRPRPALDRG